jgi:transcriptional regulator GlxA family with amidase domain
VGRELWERLQGSADWARRFAVVDAVLARLIGEDELEPALDRAWRLITASRGSRPIAAIAETLGWSRQHFARRFQDEFGLSPKLAARIVRFDRAQRMLRAAPAPVSIAQVAADCGYYDQAHMSRDFVALAGCPPGRLLDEDLPSFQDTEAEQAAPSAA